MKTLQIAEDIVPLADFKAHASRLFRRLQDGQRPLVITQNGKPAGVLITPEEFDRIQEWESFLVAVREGLADSLAGRLIDDADLDAELDAEFGTLQ